MCKKWTQGVHATTNADLIRAAWGPRRVPSRYKNKGITAYPESVAASKQMWLDWLNEPLVDTVVIVTKAYTTAPAKEKVTAMTLSDEEVADLRRQRTELRAARRFKEADAIRDKLVAHGVSIGDGRLLG